MRFWFVCVQGQATDIAIQAEEILKLKKQINIIYAKHTGQDLKLIGELSVLHECCHITKPTKAYISTETRASMFLMVIIDSLHLSTFVHEPRASKTYWHPCFLVPTIIHYQGFTYML